MYAPYAGARFVDCVHLWPLLVKTTAAIRSSPSDFVVEEIPAYEPSGQGEHLFVLIRKTGRTTLECVRALAARLAIDPRDIGYAGMKDKHAVTTQTLSLPLSPTTPIETVLEAGGDGLEVLEARRHPHKLRTGHLIANRFRVVLRKLQPGAMTQVCQQLSAAQRDGFPNAFGPQRFGRNGGNPDKALAWLRGQCPPPAPPRLRRLLFSSVQSMLFDELLRRRVNDGTWNTVCEGDLAKKHDTGGIFVCREPQADALRAARGELSATGPIFGARMRWPEGRVADLERGVLRELLGDSALLDRHAKYGEGSRRPLRLMPSEVQVSALDGSDDALVAQFVLPKGAYATTFLGLACELSDESRPHFDISKEISYSDELLDDTRTISE
jgi:tRNA pseudouridine13 synthase